MGLKRFWCPLSVLSLSLTSITYTANSSATETIHDTAPDPILQREFLSENCQRALRTVGFYTDSDPLREAVAILGRAAKTKTSILITGETGTGKEKLAQFVHLMSGRVGNLVTVNSSAVNEGLQESELFGYERGAFTGALKKKVGLIPSSSGGTLFLDEIGDMPNALQIKLLRILESEKVLRLGAEKEISVNLRLVAATNKNLENLVDEGRFRKDLFFRINGLHVQLPPLRSRPYDILTLARYFNHEIAKEQRVDPRILSEDAVKKLITHRWPGNVRELIHTIQQAYLLSRGERIEGEHIQFGRKDSGRLTIVSPDPAPNPVLPSSGPPDINFFPTSFQFLKMWAAELTSSGEVTGDELRLQLQMSENDYQELLVGNDPRLNYWHPNFSEFFRQLLARYRANEVRSTATDLNLNYAAFLGSFFKSNEVMGLFNRDRKN